MSKLYNSNEWLRSMREYGLEFLTFESCALSLRGLFDMSDKGIKLVENAFSITIDRNNTPRNWNSMVGNDKAIACIKLSPSQVRDLLIVALASKYSYVIYAKPKNTDNWSLNAHLWAGNRQEFEERRNYLNSDVGSELWSWHLFMSDHDHPMVGLDNTHTFTGRSR